MFSCCTMKSKSSTDLRQRQSTVQVDEKLNIMFIGASNSGKTSVVNNLKGKEFRLEQSTTMGIDTQHIYYEIDDNIVKVTMTDAPGQNMFNSIIKSQIKRNHGFVLVFSKNSLEELLYIEEQLLEIREQEKKLNKSFQVVILQNKSDDIQSKQSNKMNALLKKFEEKYNQVIYKCSAKTGSNIEYTFQKLLQSSYQQNKLNDSVQSLVKDNDEFSVIVSKINNIQKYNNSRISSSTVLGKKYHISKNLFTKPQFFYRKQDSINYSNISNSTSEE